ncbi:MAG TPA: flagellin [Tepidisphaeraceae bacterium]|jgi:flagellin|nr:flagellin [Tepidisphaeraceae bacterium]
MSSVINTNVSSLIAQQSLQNANNQLSTSLQRLSTGLKINSGADDPAGLIASTNLQAEQTGINQAIDNANRANNVIGTAAGGLNEVSNLLNQLNGLVNQSANSGGLSSAEVAANQLQVDSILSTINRIAGSTSFDGTKLLNGNLAYTTSSVAASALTGVQINAASLPANKTETVVVQVTNSATVGDLQYSGATSAIGGSALTLQIAGNAGTQQLTFAGSSKLSSIAAAINNITATTGVTASANGGKIDFKASNYGSTQYVSIQGISGAANFAVTGGSGSGKANGTDAQVKVNGAAAQAQGLNVSYRDNTLDVNFNISTDLNGGLTKTFGITGGGATFSLGAQVTNTDVASIGIQDVSTGGLGDATNGFLSSLGSGGANQLTSSSLVNAQNIVTEAITQVATLQGRLGAFQKYTLGSTINNLGVAYENASAAESAITDTDFAAETANLTRAQILQQSATTVLSQANSQPQNALTLLKNA